MPILQGKKEIVVGAKISQAEADAFQSICDTEDRSMSYVLRQLALRGLAQYKRDGILKLTDEDENQIIANTARTFSTSKKSVQHKKVTKEQSSSSAADALEANPEFEKKKSRAKDNAAEVKK